VTRFRAVDAAGNKSRISFNRDDVDRWAAEAVQATSTARVYATVEPFKGSRHPSVLVGYWVSEGFL
jgi:hypothetical protein